MRSVIMTSIVFFAFGVAMNAQKFSITPQVGFENSKTSISYDNLSSFAPLGVELTPQVSVRLDYKFKQGFGPYLGASTSRTLVSYNFTDIDNGMNVYKASNGNLQVRFEAGYQYTTAPIFFKKTSSAGQQKSVSSKSQSNYSYKGGCSKSYSSRSAHCQSKKSSSSKLASKSKGTWMKLQPSAGIGFIPSPKTDIVTKTSGGQTTYEYRAGNWNTALETGMGFEFGRNNQRLFTVSINYFTGIGNLTEQTIKSESGTKTSVAHLDSKTSGWNLRVGTPFTLSAKKSPVKKHHEMRSGRQSCSDRYKLQYKSRCRSF